LHTKPAPKPAPRQRAPLNIFFFTLSSHLGQAGTELVDRLEKRLDVQFSFHKVSPRAYISSPSRNLHNT
jgi:hypothetical protein